MAGSSFALSEKGRQPDEAGAKALGNAAPELRADESHSLQANQSSAPNNGGTSSLYRGKNIAAPGDNNFRTKNRKVLPAFSITQHELTSRCQAVMQEHVGNESDAAKRLANDLECSVGTAKNYLDGRTTPQGIHDARAMAVIPGYLKMKAELAGLEMTLDPRHQAKLVAFMRFCQTEADSIFGEGGQ